MVSLASHSCHHHCRHTRWPHPRRHLHPSRRRSHCRCHRRARWPRDSQPGRCRYSRWRPRHGPWAGYSCVSRCPDLRAHHCRYRHTKSGHRGHRPRRSLRRSHCRAGHRPRRHLDRRHRSGHCSRCHLRHSHPLDHSSRWPSLRPRSRRHRYPSTRYRPTPHRLRRHSHCPRHRSAHRHLGSYQDRHLRSPWRPRHDPTAHRRPRPRSQGRHSHPHRNPRRRFLDLLIDLPIAVIVERITELFGIRVDRGILVIAVFGGLESIAVLINDLRCDLIFLQRVLVRSAGCSRHK